MNLLKSLFSSKKFVASLAGVLAEVFVFAFSGLPEETAQQLGAYIVAIVSSYVLGQGIADNGKEKAKVEAAHGGRWGPIPTGFSIGGRVESTELNVERESDPPGEA